MKKLRKNQILEVRGDRGANKYQVQIIQRMIKLEKYYETLTGEKECIYLAKDIKDGKKVYITNSPGYWEIDPLINEEQEV
jgi:hypothetical protein